MPLNLVDAPIDTLVPNPWNTNEMTAENEQKLENSLTELKFIRPLIARELPDGSLQILGGEHRWQVARRLGFKTLPVVNLGPLDDLQAKKIGLVDNGRYGEDDSVKLAGLLREMGDPDELLSILPMTGNELEELFAATKISLDDLGLSDGGETLPDLATAKTGQTHMVMRFKVPIDDADYIERVIESTMKAQGFTKEDSLANAGHALVHLIRGK